MSTKTTIELIAEIGNFRNDFDARQRPDYAERLGTLTAQLPTCVRGDIERGMQTVVRLNAIAEQNPRMRSEALSAINALHNAHQQLTNLNLQQAFTSSTPVSAWHEVQTQCFTFDDAMSNASAVFDISELTP